MQNKTYKTFIDNAGRSIFGSIAAESDTEITVENPVMITVQQQQQNGQMAVQLFPLFFAEFVNPSEGDKRDTNFVYSKSSIAVGTNFSVDPRIIEQYEKIVNPVLVEQPPAQTEEPEVIKLFDE